MSLIRDCSSCDCVLQNNHDKTKEIRNMKSARNISTALAASMLVCGTLQAESMEAKLSHNDMKMRIGFPALIPTGAAYPTLEITSDYEAEGAYELEVIRESDGHVVDRFSGTLQHGESVTLLENTQASEPGTYRLQLKYILGDRVLYEAFYFTVGLEQLRAHLPGTGNFSEIVFPGPDGQLIYIPDFRGNHIPDFSRVG
ncbi:MAG: hypothetical protein JJU05_19150, partial [Verrucomicrobia bacterium]|nr:hypothetical protein [Verrucomicrobiota bacterium]